MQISPKWEKFIMPNMILVMVFTIAVGMLIDELEGTDIAPKPHRLFDRTGKTFIFNVLLEQACYMLKLQNIKLSVPSLLIILFQVMGMKF